MADETWNVAQMAYISAINAEIEGMKALNSHRLQRGETIAYDKEAFQKMANALHSIYNTCMENR